MVFDGEELVELCQSGDGEIDGDFFSSSFEVFGVDAVEGASAFEEGDSDCIGLEVGYEHDDAYENEEEG